MELNKIKALTITHLGLANVLKSKCTICIPSITGTGTNRIEVEAIWDTGATTTCITQDVVDKICSVASGKCTVSGATGDKASDTHIVDIVLPHGITVQGVNVIALPDLKGCDVLIGMDIIALGDFTITNFEKKTVFTFRTPSQKKVDYVDEWNRRAAVEGKHNGSTRKK